MCNGSNVRIWIRFFMTTVATDGVFGASEVQQLYLALCNNSLEHLQQTFNWLIVSQNWTAHREIDGDRQRETTIFVIESLILVLSRNKSTEGRGSWEEWDSVHVKYERHAVRFSFKYFRRQICCLKTRIICRNP